MTTASILFEQYKVLPKHIQQRYRNLIEQAEKPAKPPVVDADADEDDETGDTIRISLEALHSSIEQVKLLQAGKLKTQPAHTMLAEVKAELAAGDAAKAKRTQKAA